MNSNNELEQYTTQGEGNRMSNDAREAEQVWWPGNFASATGGTDLEALRELALAKFPGRAKPSARVSPATLGQNERSRGMRFSSPAFCCGGK